MANTGITTTLLHKILDESSDGIQVSDLNGNMVYINRIAEDRLGISRENIHHYRVQDFEEIFAEKEAWDKHVQEIRNTGGLIIQGININQTTAGRFPVEVSVKIAEVDGSEYVIASSRDITDRKKAESKLTSALQLTQDQNEQLQSFAQIVSHNLRTHAANLGSLLELLKDEISDLEKSEVFQYLVRGSDQLNQTIQHLSDVAKMRYIDKADLSSINLRDCCEKCIDNLSATTKHNSIIIENKIESNLEVLGIPAYVDSIFLNLLTNSIKYRKKEGPCQIKLAAESRHDYARVDVIDNGLGIDLEKHGKDLFKIYKTFHDVQDSQGVGLFITKNQVESLGGKIEVKSKVGQGTTFSVYLKSADQK